MNFINEAFIGNRFILGRVTWCLMLNNCAWLSLILCSSEIFCITAPLFNIHSVNVMFEGNLLCYICQLWIFKLIPSNGFSPQPGPFLTLILNVLVRCELRHPGRGEEAADGPDSESALVAVRRRVGATAHTGTQGGREREKRETWKTEKGEKKICGRQARRHETNWFTQERAC